MSIDITDIELTKKSVYSASSVYKSVFPVIWLLQRSVYDRCGPFEYYDSALSRMLFPGGYIFDGVVYNYVTDWQGNVPHLYRASLLDDSGIALGSKWLTHTFVQASS